MKFASKIAALVLTGALALVLCGCEMIGFGDDGSGLPEVGEPKVTPPAIAADGTLRVGVNGANAPFSTMADGRMVGIDVDIAAALANELGLKVEMVDVGLSLEESLEAGTVDVVLGMDTTNTSATCWLSDPYLKTAIAIFATSSGALLPTADGKQVIEAQESSMSAWEITNQFGEEALKTVPDLKSVFDDLESGATTYGAADAIIGSYVSHTSANNSMIIGLMQKAGGYCVGVTNSNRELKTAVAEAIESMLEKGIVGVIQSKWIGTELNLDAMALTEAASRVNEKTKEAKEEEEKKEEAEEEKTETELGEVGGNAVDLQDDGSTGEGNDAPVVDWNYVPDYNQTYVDPNAGTDQTYVDPNAGAGTGDAGTGDAGTGDAGTGDAGTGDAGTGDAGTDGGDTADTTTDVVEDASSGDDLGITDNGDFLDEGDF